MKKVSRVFLFVALVLVLLTAACGAEGGATPTPIATLPGVEETSAPPGNVETTQTAATPAETSTAGLETPTLGSTENAPTPATLVGTTATGITQTPSIPVTGLDIELVECQFCVDTLAHALLVLPDTATFDVTTPAASTTTSIDALNTNCSTIEVISGKQVVLCSGPEKTSITLNICTNANTCTDFPVDLQACPLTQSGTGLPTKTQEVPGVGTASATPTPGALLTPSATATP